MKTRLLIAAGLVSLAAPATASGQTTTRAWVSQHGTDTNDCLFATPCRTFERAAAVLDEGGEINAQTDGAFGDFFINDGLTLDGRGHSVGITAAEGGINIDASGDRVTFRNLHIQGFPVGADDAIQVTNVGHLRLDHVTIRGMPGHGVDFRSATVPSRLTVRHSSITDNGKQGIALAPGFLGPAGAFKRVVIRHSEISSNGANGIWTGPSSPPSANPLLIGVFDSTLADNGQHGLLADGAKVQARIGTNVFTGNLGHGIRAQNGGGIVSYGTNQIYGNGIDGVPTSTVPQS